MCSIFLEKEKIGRTEFEALFGDQVIQSRMSNRSGCGRGYIIVVQYAQK